MRCRDSHKWRTSDNTIGTKVLEPPHRCKRRAGDAIEKNRPSGRGAAPANFFSDAPHLRSSISHAIIAGSRKNNTEVNPMMKKIPWPRRSAVKTIGKRKGVVPRLGSPITEKMFRPKIDTLTVEHEEAHIIRSDSTPRDSVYYRRRCLYIAWCAKATGATTCTAVR